MYIVKMDSTYIDLEKVRYALRLTETNPRLRPTLRLVFDGSGFQSSEADMFDIPPGPRADFIERCLGELAVYTHSVAEEKNEDTPDRSEADVEDEGSDPDTDDDSADS